MKRYILFFSLAVAPFMLCAQSDDRDDLRKNYDDLRESMFKDFYDSKDKIVGDYKDFRANAMKEYIDFVREAWELFEGKKTEPVPEMPPVPPVAIPDEERNIPVDDTPVPIKDILPPIEVLPQPQPIQPIEVLPVAEDNLVLFTFFGTQAAVHFDVAKRVVLSALNEDAIADALEAMANGAHDSMIADCLRIRESYGLSDWAYINMLDALSKKVYGGDVNSATLLMAYLYMQSGYQMRLATDNCRLYMLYASRHYIYEQPCFVVDDVRYYSVEELPLRLNICQAAFENEAPLSLLVSGGQNLAFKPAKMHHIESVDYPEFSVNVVVNENLLDFYSSFPTSMLGDNMYTRWAMYADTEIDERVASDFYPALKGMIAGMSEVEATERLLNLVQTGFEYRYDDEVWGGDRVFFPDEALFYGYNDCDDRSVLFSRLIRDLLGLETALVFVPGHVLVGVEFNEDVKGGYVMVGERKFVLCEPTCTNGAPVGWNDIDEGVELNVYLLGRSKAF